MMTPTDDVDTLKASQIQLLVDRGIISKNSLGISEKEAEKIYARAKQLYESGKFRVARALFSLLALLDPKSPAILYGLASSCLMMNDLDPAVDIFLEYAALVPSDPYPYYFVSSCFEKKQDIPSAMIALQTAINRSGEQTQHQEIKQRCLLALENLIKLATIKADIADTVNR